MDILKNANCSHSLIICLSLVIAVPATTQGASYEKAKTPEEILIATYELPHTITPAEAKSAVSHLERTLTDCKGSYLAFRIRYRMGVLYFRADMMKPSKAEFLRTANDPKCPKPIRACSFNMIGQISRLLAENEEALKSFDKVVNLLEQSLSVDRRYDPNSAMAKLWCSALLSRAEIYELQHDYTASINEYGRLLYAVNQSRNIDMMSQYAPLSYDRMSQLYLRVGNIEKYTELTRALIERYPEYSRTPIVQFELECVKFLKSTSTSFHNGSFYAPALVIAYLKSSNNSAPAQSIIDSLNVLCEAYQSTHAGIFLQYHYAWLLDTVGEEQKAREILSRISSTDTFKANDNSLQEAIAGTIQEYAKIQYAIMAGEKAEYNEALRVLSSLHTHADESHISELAKAVTKGIQTLKREDPKNDSEER
jgi:tetratricopeptide (TPR) repeat protein